MHHSEDRSILQAALKHIKKDVTYPATRHDIMRTCNFREISRAEQDWLEKTLPNRKYSSPEEVVVALLKSL